MTRAAEYPSVRCCRHGLMLVDVVGPDGAITHECPGCCREELVLIDVVRQLFERSKVS
ncbi:MAG TPA: hypothetical protein VK540_30480 [Polyangiaceae bacterium]|nr:hypothetical protein [Polyangiaceae bacterium]